MYRIVICTRRPIYNANRQKPKTTEWRLKQKNERRKRNTLYTGPSIGTSPHTSPRQDSLFCFLHLHAHTALSAGGITLHLLADLDVDVEELADAAVETNGLALVQLAFAVVVGDTFLGAGLGETGNISLANQKSEKMRIWNRGVEGGSATG